MRLTATIRRGLEQMAVQAQLRMTERQIEGSPQIEAAFDWIWGCKSRPILSPSPSQPASADSVTQANEQALSSLKTMRESMARHLPSTVDVDETPT